MLEILTIQEVSSHEELQCDLWGDGELGDLCGAVGVAGQVAEVMADLAQDVGRDLAEGHLIGLVLSEAPWSG